MSYIGQGLPADSFQGFTTDSFTGDGSATTFTLSKKPFDELFINAINYADNGFPVTEVIGYYLQLSSARYKSYPNFADVWMPNGEALKKGDIFVNKDLANTYKKIA